MLWREKVYLELYEVNNPFLCFHIRFDVALGGGERSMSSEHLNISE